jgi:SHS2 domain-containing protein
MPTCLIEELGHTAEIGVRVQAGSAEELFACTAQAMFGLLRVHPDESRQATPRLVTIDSIDGESLLVDWLNELVYLYETSGLIFTQYKILAWSATHLEAEVSGYRSNGVPALQIKAVTYHQLLLRGDANGWTAQVFFDI